MFYEAEYNMKNYSQYGIALRHLHKSSEHTKAKSKIFPFSTKHGYLELCVVRVFTTVCPVLFSSGYEGMFIVTYMYILQIAVGICYYYHDFRQKFGIFYLQNVRNHPLIYSARPKTLSYCALCCSVFLRYQQN